VWPVARGPPSAWGGPKGWECQPHFQILGAAYQVGRAVGKRQHSRATQGDLTLRMEGGIERRHFSQPAMGGLFKLVG